MGAGASEPVENTCSCSPPFQGTRCLPESSGMFDISILPI